jgi:hypothetical protein
VSAFGRLYGVCMGTLFQGAGSVGGIVSEIDVWPFLVSEVLQLTQ